MNEESENESSIVRLWFGCAVFVLRKKDERSFNEEEYLTFWRFLKYSISNNSCGLQIFLVFLLCLVLVILVQYNLLNLLAHQFHVIIITAANILVNTKLFQ